MILEYNNFTRSYHEAGVPSYGSDVLDVWSEEITFSSDNDRATYFSRGGTAHVLTVSVHVDFDQQVIYRYAYDDEYIDQIFPPTIDLPSDAELYSMLSFLMS